MRAKSCQSSGFHAAALAAKGRRPRFWRELPDCWRHLTRLVLRALLLDPRGEKLWGGRRRSWHLHRPHELMEVAPWPKSMISAEA